MKPVRPDTYRRLILLTGLGIVVLFLANLFWGSVSIPFSEVCRILTGGDPEKATGG